MVRTHGYGKQGIEGGGTPLTITPNEPVRDVRPSTPQLWALQSQRPLFLKVDTLPRQHSKVPLNCSLPLPLEHFGLPVSRDQQARRVTIMSRIISRELREG